MKVISSFKSASILRKILEFLYPYFVIWISARKPPHFFTFNALNRDSPLWLFYKEKKSFSDDVVFNDYTCQSGTKGMVHRVHRCTSLRHTPTPLKLSKLSVNSSDKGNEQFVSYWSTLWKLMIFLYLTHDFNDVVWRKPKHSKLKHIKTHFSHPPHGIIWDQPPTFGFTSLCFLTLSHVYY